MKRRSRTVLLGVLGSVIAVALVLAPLTAAAKPTRDQPVWRFYNIPNGSHFYTADEAEMLRVIAGMPTIYRFEGEAWRVFFTPGNGVQMYRFFNLQTGTHFYSADPVEVENVLRLLGWKYRFEGPAYLVSLDPMDMPVWRFYNIQNGTHFYTNVYEEKESVLKKLRHVYRYEGVAFYLMPAK
jgi:hypothetical protein